MRALCLPLLLVTGLQLLAAEPSFHAVAVPADGEPFALTAEQIGAADSLPVADHYWIWNDTSGARNLTREQMESLVDGRDSIEDAPRCALRFSPARTKIDKAIVRVAPVEMWSEMPEDLIPTFDLPKTPPFSIPLAHDGATRLRVSMEKEGSSWIAVPPGRREIAVPLTGTADHMLRVVDGEGRAIPDVHLSLLARGTRGDDFLTRLVGTGDGAVRLLALPEHLEYELVVGQKDHATITVRGTVRQLPDRVTLPAGAALFGQLVDGEKKPVPGASVVVEAWISDDAGALFRKEIRSDESGRWRIEQVPMRRVVVAILHAAYAMKRTELDVDEPLVDLGRQVLSPGITVKLKVVDDRDAPVAAAKVRLQGDEREWQTDAKGISAMTSIDALAELQGTIDAKGHVRKTFEFHPPFDGKFLQVTVTRAFQVEGRFVDQDGVAVGEGNVKIQTGNSYRVEDLEEGGRFRLTLAAGVDYELTFASRSSGQAVVPVAKGAAGENRDLGDVRPFPGATIRGQLVSAEQPEGIEGATIWCPRPTGSGPVVAWLNGNIASVDSGDQGRFELKGLPYAPVALRIDAPGYARKYLDLTLIADQPPVNLGALTLDRGVDFQLAVDGAPDGATAKLDLRGEWLDPDMLTAPVSEGVARFNAVAPGEVIATVTSGRDVLCEAKIAIPADVSSYRADCMKETIEVVGRVTLGGRNAGAGTLTFASTQAAPSAAIISIVSPSGSVRQEMYGIGSPNRFADVDELGEFHLHGMRAGEWRVTWQPDGAGPSPPRTVQVPAIRKFEMALDFPAGRISGRVVDSDHNPVPYARVLELDGRASTLAGTDGSFQLGGLAPGPKRLQARLGERESDILETVVEADRENASELILRDGEANALRLRVLDDAGQPASGAIVFIDTIGSYTRIVTADATGFATTRYSSAMPSSVRLAAFYKGGWLLTGTMSSEAARDGYVARFGLQGTLRVSVEDGSPSLVRIGAPGAWDLGNLLATLGLRPLVSTASPLALQLPEGEYEIGVGAESKRVFVEEGRSADIAFKRE